MIKYPLLLTSCLLLGGSAMAQDGIGFQLYTGPTFGSVAGSLAHSDGITDGYSKGSFSMDLGVNVRLIEGFGIMLEYSEVSFNVENGDQAFEQVELAYLNSPEFQLDNRDIFVFGGQVGGNDWLFSTPKIGISRSKKLGRVGLFAAVKVGLLLPSKSKTTLFVQNTNETVEIENPNFHYLHETFDGFAGYSYSYSGSGWIGGVDLRVLFYPLKEEKFHIFGGIESALGKFDYTYVEKIVDPIIPSNDSEITIDDGLSFTNIAVKVGVGFDLP